MSAAGAVQADFLGGLNDAERDELEEIHKALERIERGIYGRCEGCGARVEDERIESRPWERSCAECSSGKSVEVPAHA